MSREVMKLALEALEESLGYVEEEAENAQRLYGQYPTRQARIQGLKDDVRKHMNDSEKVWQFLREIYGMDLTAATLVVLIKDGETAVKFKTIYFPQQEST